MPVSTHEESSEQFLSFFKEQLEVIKKTGEKTRDSHLLGEN